jgi:hypothetical protein
MLGVEGANVQAEEWAQRQRCAPIGDGGVIPWHEVAISDEALVAQKGGRRGAPGGFS